MTNMTGITPMRKQAGREICHAVPPKRLLGGNILALTTQAKEEIYYKWDKLRIPMRDIARQEGLLVAHVENLLWYRENAAPGPTTPATPKLRESRGLHLISARKAA